MMTCSPWRPPERSPELASEEGEAREVVGWPNGIAVPGEARRRQFSWKGKRSLGEVMAIAGSLDELSKRGDRVRADVGVVIRWYTYVSALFSPWRLRCSIAKWFALDLNLAPFGVSYALARRAHETCGRRPSSAMRFFVCTLLGHDVDAPV
jgi:hypothetical protein